MIRGFLLVLCLFSLPLARISLHYDGALNKGLRFYGVEDSHANAAAPAQWFTQKLDHFDPTNKLTWQQKYYVNDSNWQGDGSPIFFMLGGEGPVGPTCVGGHFIFSEWAYQLGGMAICIEHRFYGESVPTEDTSYESLRYLTSQQALTDNAYFKTMMTEQYEAPNSPWIAFGGSYSGALSAWQRIKFPHLFAGAIASSAPVEAELDFSQYFEVIANSVGPTCANRIQQMTNQVEVLLNSPAGRQHLETLFNTCAPITTDNDAAQFVGSLSDVVSGVVQYNNDNVNYQPFNMQTMCGYINAGTDALQAFANYVAIYNEATQTSCTDTDYDAFITAMQETSPTSDNLAARSWTWQTCVEYGYYQTSETQASPFSPRITLDFYVQQCQDIFGVAMTPATAWTNTYYGSNTPAGSNIFFPNGNVDPWHILGVLDDVSATETHVLMQNTAHCADLYMPRALDDPALATTRATELNLIHQWVEEFANSRQQ